LLDADHGVLAIKGTRSLRSSLLDALDENDNAVWFEFEEEKMYSKREGELIQRYHQQHGKMPGADEDDLSWNRHIKTMPAMILVLPFVNAAIF